MPSTQTLNAPSHPSLPLAMRGKSPYYSPPPMAHQVPYARPIISPPTPGSSVNTSAVPSLTSGSQTGEDNVPHGASGIDLVEMLNNRLSNAVDTLPLDRSLVRQAQTSGELNAKHREILELQALAQRRLKATQANFADGVRAAKEVKRDLDWTQKRVSTLKIKAEKKYPAEYRAANERYPAPVEY